MKSKIEFASILMISIILMSCGVSKNVNTVSIFRYINLNNNERMVLGSSFLGKEHLTEKLNDSIFIKDGVFSGAESIEVIIDARNKISKLIFEYDESLDKNNKIESYVKDLGIPIVKSGKAIWNDEKTQFEIYTKRKKGKKITYSKLIDLKTK